MSEEVEPEPSLAGSHLLLRCPVSSAISCIVIKSDHISRKNPQLGQIVGVVGEHGSFVVISIDQQAQIAQVMERSGRHRLVEVPFASLRSFNRNLADTLHCFLQSREEGGDKQPR